MNPMREYIFEHFTLECIFSRISYRGYWGQLFEATRSNYLDSSEYCVTVSYFSADILNVVKVLSTEHSNFINDEAVSFTDVFFLLYHMNCL